MSSISNISSGYLQSILSGALQGAGLNANTTGKSLSSAAVSSTGLQTDNQRLSPFAQLMNTLQQLQQSDPIKYQQVTQQIGINLQSAAQTSQADGNSTAAKQLNQLAADFTSASKSGQLPNIRDLAQAIGGHHHQHHGHHTAAADSDGDSSSSSTSSSAPQSLSQLSALQPNGTLDSLNPISIILNTLSSAGIGGSNSW